MASKNKGSIFRDMVKKNIASQKEGGSYGYLKLPQGISLFKPDPESKVTVDFMCYKVTSKKHLDRDDESGLAVPGSIWYKSPFKTHDNVGAKNDKVVCLQTFGKKCPICEFAEEERKKGADSDTLKDLRPKNRSLYVLIPLDSKKFEKKMYLFDISDHIFQKMLNAELKEDEENMPIIPDVNEEVLTPMPMPKVSPLALSLLTEQEIVRAYVAAECLGNQSEAARVMDVSRQRLHGWLNGTKAEQDWLVANRVRDNWVGRMRKDILAKRAAEMVREEEA